MSKKNWFLIIGLASLALIFLSFVGYVVKRTNERKKEINKTNERKKEINKNFEEIEAELKEKKAEMEAELELKDKMLLDNGKKIKSFIWSFQKNFGINEKNKLIMSNQEIHIGIQKIPTDETSLKTLGKFLGVLSVHLKKFNEIKYDFSEIKKEIHEHEQLMKISLRSETQGDLQELQKNFNKVKKDYDRQIKEESKISFINPANQDKLHDLLIIQNEELIINPEISKCFTTKQLNIINKSKEEAEKNLNPPSTIIQDSNFRSPARQIPLK